MSESNSGKDLRADTGAAVSVVDQSLIRLTWPIFIELLLVFLITAVDAYFLSRVSDRAAASVGAVMPITGLAFMIFNTIAQAGNSVASQRLGAKDHQQVGVTYALMAMLNLAVGLVAGLMFFTFAPNFAAMMGLSGEMAEMAVLYQSIVGGCIGILSVRFAFSAMFASRGKTRMNMWAALVMNLCNIFFNYALVEGHFGFPAMGLAGIAWSSVISWSASLLFALWVFFGHLKLSLPLHKLRGHWQKSAKPVLNIAVPASMEPLSYQFSQIVITMMVVTLGDIALAARVYSLNLLFLPMLWCFGLASGCQIKVAHLIGARRFDDAHQQLMYGLKLAMGGALVMTALLRLGVESLMGIFTHQPEILALGAMVLSLALLGELGRALNVVVGGCLRASGDARFNATVGVSVMWLFAVPACWLFGLHWAWGLAGIWLAMSLDEVFRGLIALARWRSRKWISKGVYAQEAAEAA